MEYKLGVGLSSSKLVRDLKDVEKGAIGKENLHLLRGVYKRDIIALLAVSAIVFFAMGFVGIFWMCFEQFNHPMLCYTGIVLIVIACYGWYRVRDFCDNLETVRRRNYWKRINMRIENQKRNWV